MIIAERDKQKSSQLNTVNGFQVLYAHSSILLWTSKIVRMIYYGGGFSVDCLCSL